MKHFYGVAWSGGIDGGRLYPWVNSREEVYATHGSGRAFDRLVVVYSLQGYSLQGRGAIASARLGQVSECVGAGVVSCLFVDSCLALRYELPAVAACEVLVTAALDLHRD